MPGIVGIVSRRPPELCTKDLRTMIECMIHEPFYNSYTYVNEKLCLYAGVVCHPQSFSDPMPVSNETGDLVLLFSGEHFADLDSTNRLKQQGHSFDPSTASYLIHLYEEQGNQFFAQLNGWFSGIIIDLRRSAAVLFNDRYGVHRVYYHDDGEAILFSSEAKSLLKLRAELRNIAPEKLGEFFSCGATLQDRSLFSNVFLVPPASVWTFRNGRCTDRNFYFTPRTWENQLTLDGETFYQQLAATFRRTLPRYFVSRNPLALSATGGLDTRMILANTRVLPRTIPCYTFGGLYRDSFDITISRAVADACQQTHCTLGLDRAFFTNFPALAEKTVYVTDGTLGVCGSHDLYLNRLAREIAPVRMTGKFGSEVLRGATTFRASPPSMDLFHPDFKKYVEMGVSTFGRTTAKPLLSFTLFSDIPLNEYGRLALEQSQVTYRTPYMDNDFVKLVYQAPEHACDTQEISLRLISDGNDKLLRIMTDRGVGGTSNFLLSKLIQLSRYASFKAEWYYNEGMPGWLAKVDYSLRRFGFEKLLLGRHKIEHYRIWFRDDLSDYVREVLLDKTTTERPFLKKGFMERMVSAHLKGDANYTREIDTVLTAELIYRLLIEKI
jgi:asparagine synthase (glutamine-hydrolysing)